MTSYFYSVGILYFEPRYAGGKYYDPGHVQGSVFSVDDIQCSGSEADISECPGWTQVHNCGNHEVCSVAIAIWN